MTWCIELIIFAIFLCFFVLLFKNIANKNPSVLPLLDALSEFRMQLILRSPEFPSANSPCEKFLFSLMREAYFQGKAIGSSCELLALQILKSEEYRIAKSRFLSMVLFRILSVLTISILARVYLSIFFDVDSRDLLNLTSLLMSFSISLCFFLAMNRFYPQSWFFNHEGQDWLHGLLMGHVTNTSPIYETWQKMDDQEKCSGISLASTKSLLIATWRSKKEIELEDTLRVFEDCVPAAEFLCLGTSSILILWGPISQIVSF